MQYNLLNKQLWLKTVNAMPTTSPVADNIVMPFSNRLPAITMPDAAASH